MIYCAQCDTLVYLGNDQCPLCGNKAMIDPAKLRDANERMRQALETISARHVLTFIVTDLAGVMFHVCSESQVEDLQTIAREALK